MSRKNGIRGAFILTVVIMMMMALTPMSGAVNGNLVDNGDFELGNTVFYTDYDYVDAANTGGWTLGPENSYTVSTDPNLYHSAWASFGDHTAGDGNMMIVNGTPPPQVGAEPNVVWGDQTQLGVDEHEGSFLLRAGQDWEVGNVLVVNDSGGETCVTLVLFQETLDAGYLMTEVHVDFATDVADIPQKNGNPIPGQFEYKFKFNPGEAVAGPYCSDVEDEIIGAHAVVERPEISHVEDTTIVIDQTYDKESAWGGSSDFPGKNWAYYIVYGALPLTYEFTMYAANTYAGSTAYPANPAELKVTFDGVQLGTPMLLGDPFVNEIPTGVWFEFREVWTAADSTVTWVAIEIKDLTLIAYGDDFAIDDISLMPTP